MATNFPTSIDALTNPTGASSLTSPDHAGQHTDANDAIEAIETQIGTTASPVLARLASPTFTGTPTLPTGTIATTQTAADSSTKVATTAFVTTANNLKANIASPTFTSTVAVTGGALGTTAGNELIVSSITATNTNTDIVRTKYRRVSGGADWTSAQAKIQRTIDATDMGYVAFGGTSAFDVRIGSNTTDIATFVNTGRVGIGTSAPSTTLEVSGSTTIGSQNNVAATFGSATSGRLLVGSITGNTPLIGSEGATNLLFNTNATERMRIDSAGNVGIGTSSPSTALQVNGTVTATSYTGALASAVTATTQTAGNNTTAVATTAFVNTAITDKITGWTAFTPSFTGVTAGTGASNTGQYCLVNNILFIRVKYLLGTGGSFTNPIMTLPASKVATGSPTFLRMDSLQATMVDILVNAYPLSVRLDTTTTIGFSVHNSSGTYVTSTTGVSSTVPFTSAVGDFIEVAGWIQVD